MFLGTNFYYLTTWLTPWFGYIICSYVMFLFSKQHEELVGIYASQLAPHRCIDLFVHMMEVKLNSRWSVFCLKTVWFFSFWKKGEKICQVEFNGAIDLWLFSFCRKQFYWSHGKNQTWQKGLGTGSIKGFPIYGDPIRRKDGLLASLFINFGTNQKLVGDRISRIFSFNLL